MSVLPSRLSDAVFGMLPVALLVVDSRLRVVTANPECERLFGFCADTARNLPFDEVLPAELVGSGELGELLAAASADRQPGGRTAGCRAIRPGGGEQVFDVEARRLDDDGRLLLVLSEVTEREARLRRIGDTQRTHESIIQNMNSALLVIGLDARIRTANAPAESILGAEPGALCGRLVWDWFQDARRDGTLLVRTLEEGRRFKGAETSVAFGDGRTIPIGISCAPLVAGDGSRSGAVAIFQDLSEIVALQRQVLQTEKMASIGQLAAGVAHEVNNPMGFIHANLSQMAEYIQDLRQVWEQVEALAVAAEAGALEAVRGVARELGDVSRELDIPFVMRDFAKAIRESQEGSERIRHIVQDLRDFSHQDTGDRVCADVNQCLDSTVNIVWTMMKHSAVLKKEYCDLPQIRCFPMQLKQVFMNLLVNAYQAIEERVGDSGEIGEISICTFRQEDGVAISVEDTGIGIPEKDLDRIFDPFFTTKKVGSGTGLGLSTSFSIVARHRGRIQVDSTPGRGSRFVLWLPIGDGPGEKPKRAVAVSDVG